MSKADLIFKENCKQILEHGFSTEGQTVRAKWEDGAPAHTKDFRCGKQIQPAGGIPHDDPALYQLEKCHR